MKAKYIIHCDCPVIFPCEFDHAETAYNLGFFDEDGISGAGFVTLVDGKFQCYGSSFSLGIESTDECSVIVNAMLGIH